ncbi:MAG: terminase small subunit [Bacteroidales bacterium]
MAAPKKNRFWELRSKHGRGKIFKSPSLLWDACCEYFLWCEKNPLKEQVVFHAQGIITKSYVAKMRPFTIQGLVSFLDVNVNYLNQFEDSLKGKKDKSSKDFSLICTRVREIIYRQKFEGAASGFFNANIIARDLGLSEKTETDLTTKGEKITGINYIVPKENANND